MTRREAAGLTAHLVVRCTLHAAWFVLHVATPGGRARLSPWRSSR